MHLRETLTLEEPEKQMNPYDVVVFFHSDKSNHWDFHRNQPYNIFWSNTTVYQSLIVYILWGIFHQYYTMETSMCQFNPTVTTAYHVSTADHSHYHCD